MMEMGKFKIVVATTNAGKLSEIRAVLSDYDVISAADAGFVDDVEEKAERVMKLFAKIEGDDTNA